MQKSLDPDGFLEVGGITFYPIEKQQQKQNKNTENLETKLFRLWQKNVFMWNLIAQDKKGIEKKSFQGFVALF